MAKREVLVIEVSDRGKDDWKPLKGESFTDEADAQRNLRAFAEPARDLWEYRLTPYAPAPIPPREPQRAELWVSAYGETATVLSAVAGFSVTYQFDTATGPATVPLADFLKRFREPMLSPSEDKPDSGPRKCWRCSGKCIVAGANEYTSEPCPECHGLGWVEFVKDTAQALLSMQEERVREAQARITQLEGELLNSVTQEQHQEALTWLTRWRSKYHASRREVRRLNAALKTRGLELRAWKAHAVSQSREYWAIRESLGKSLAASDAKVTALEVETRALTSERDTLKAHLKELHEAVCGPRLGSLDSFTPYTDLDTANMALQSWRRIRFEDRAKMGRLSAVVEAAREVLEWFEKDGSVGMADGAFAPLKEALSALDQPSKPEPAAAAKHTCQLAATTSGADCHRCKQLGIDSLTVEPVHSILFSVPTPGIEYEPVSGKRTVRVSQVVFDAATPEGMVFYGPGGGCELLDLFLAKYRHTPHTPESTPAAELCCTCGHGASTHAATVGVCHAGDCQCLNMTVTMLTNPSVTNSDVPHADDYICECGHRVGNHGTIAGDPVFCHSQIGKRAWCQCEMGRTDWESCAPEPPDSPDRPITPESKWRYTDNGDMASVQSVDDRSAHIVWLRTGERRAWPIEAFRKSFTWDSDADSSASEPRAIVVGSTWQHNFGHGRRKVYAIDDAHGQPCVKVEGVGPGGWPDGLFRKDFTWVSDPPTVEPAKCTCPDDPPGMQRVAPGCPRHNP